MAGKPRPLIIEAQDFRVFLAARMGALRLSVAELAQELGITPTGTYALLTGDLEPSAEVLRKVGLRQAYVLDELPDGSAAEKGKVKK
jgi:hypothetical protein